MRLFPAVVCFRVLAAVVALGLTMACSQAPTQTSSATDATAEPAAPDDLATRDLGLVGNRFPPPAWADMTPEQQAMIAHTLAGPRDSLGGPFNVLLRSPEMGDLAQEFGASMRFLTSIPAKLRELAIIVTARHWTAQFEWTAHSGAARNAGLSEEIIQAIAEGRRPTGMAPDEEIVYNFATELLETKRVSDATFASTKELLGERGVVDVTALMGYYQLVSMMLNLDEYPSEEELKPLPGR